MCSRRQCHREESLWYLCVLFRDGWRHIMIIQKNKDMVWPTGCSHTQKERYPAASRSELETTQRLKRWVKTVWWMNINIHLLNYLLLSCCFVSTAVWAKLENYWWGCYHYISKCIWPQISTYIRKHFLETLKFCSFHQNQCRRCILGSVLYGQVSFHFDAGGGVQR